MRRDKKEGKCKYIYIYISLHHQYSLHVYASLYVTFSTTFSFLESKIREKYTNIFFSRIDAEERTGVRKLGVDYTPLNTRRVSERETRLLINRV